METEFFVISHVLLCQILIIFFLRAYSVLILILDEGLFPLIVNLCVIFNHLTEPLLSAAPRYLFHGVVQSRLTVSFSENQFYVISAHRPVR